MQNVQCLKTDVAKMKFLWKPFWINALKVTFITISSCHRFSRHVVICAWPFFSTAFFFFLFASLTGQHMVTWLSFASMYLCKKIHMIYINAYQIPQRKTAFLIYTFRTNDISKNICSTTFHRQEPCLQEMGRIVACSAKIRRHWHFQDMNWIGMQFTSETIVL